MLRPRHSYLLAQEDCVPVAAAAADVLCARVYSSMRYRNLIVTSRSFCLYIPPVDNASTSLGGMMTNHCEKKIDCGSSPSLDSSHITHTNNRFTTLAPFDVRSKGCSRKSNNSPLHYSCITKQLYRTAFHVLDPFLLPTTDIVE